MAPSSADTNQVGKYTGCMRVGRRGLKPLMGRYLARREVKTLVAGTLGPLSALPT